MKKFRNQKHQQLEHAKGVVTNDSLIRKDKSRPHRQQTEALMMDHPVPQGLFQYARYCG